MEINKQNTEVTNNVYGLNFTDLIPCVFLWLFTPLEIIFMRCSKERNIPLNWFNGAKLAGNSIIVSITMFDLSNTIFNDTTNEAFSYVFLVSFLKMITFMLNGIFMIANMKMGLVSSGILFVFSFLTVICDCVPIFLEIYYNFNTREKTMISVSHMIYCVVILIIFILNCFADSKPCYSKYSNENCIPDRHSSFLRRVLFTWFDPIMSKGNKGDLQLNDLWNLHFEHMSAGAVPELQKNWLKEKESSKNTKKLKRKDSKEYTFKYAYEEVNCCDTESQQTNASILIPLIRTFGFPFLYTSLLKLFDLFIVFINPLILSLLIDHINGNGSSWKGYIYSIMLFFFALLESLNSSQFQYYIGLTESCITTSVASLIYKKILCISNNTKQNYTSGEIMNLLTIDSKKFRDALIYLNFLWCAPLQILISMYYVWKMLGPSALTGLTVLVVVIPLYSFLLKRSKMYKTKQMIYKDKRTRTIYEVLTGIKLIKFYAWEKFFMKKVTNIRNKEIGLLKKCAYLEGLTLSFWLNLPFIISVLTFTMYVLSSENNLMDPKVIFVSLAMINLLRNPLNFLPAAFTQLIEVLISIKRINKFLNSEEINLNNVSKSDAEYTLMIKNGSFSWDGCDGSLILRNIDLKITVGSLVAVVGRVGSGKTSLINAFLGEMYKVSGFVNVKGSVAYVPQQAWILNATFRQNITFGQPVSIELYNNVIKACALEDDLLTFPGGDLTEIGEKGINLSGGQKQRISIARAICIKSDIYFLDDPLSSVDSRVGSHIFENVIGPNGLLRKKTRVFVTHNVIHLSKADLIVMVNDDGSISQYGTYIDLMNKNNAFTELLLTYALRENANNKKGVSSNVVEKLGKKESFYRMSAKIVKNNDVISNPKAINKFITNEHKETNYVKKTNYLYYLKAIGCYYIVLVLLVNATTHCLSFISGVWIAEWTNDQNMVQDGKQNITVRNYYLRIYLIIGSVSVTASFFGNLLLFLGLLKAAKVMHENLLKSAINWKMELYDETPVGRIMNRLSHDVYVLDVLMSKKYVKLFNRIGSIISVILTVIYVAPWFCTVIIPFGIALYLLQLFFLRTSQQIRRLQSTSFSEVYSHFIETIAGVQCIRSFNYQKMFLLQFQSKFDTFQKCSFHSKAAVRWLSLRVETIGATVILCSSLFAVLRRDSLTASMIGLSVGYALQVTRSFSWFIKTSSEIQTNFVSVERIREYSSIPTELIRHPDSEDTKISQDWPRDGAIIVKNLKLQYREQLGLVLKGISFSVQGGEKVGIVGRTGAGKSSLTSALFRIMEPIDGIIVIDDIDISKIPLHVLRSKLTIIPQDPILFSGSLRFNLDPSNIYSDVNLWSALEHVNLKALSNGLDFYVKEGGENFSVGQRQLLCLARAWLRKPKILVLDEATAAIDLETDEVIQKTIRNEFRDCTVLTIAHRLNTVMDYDKIMVLDQGRIVEYDAPDALMKSKSSLFYSMALDAGLA